MTRLQAVRILKINEALKEAQHEARRTLYLMNKMDAKEGDKVDDKVWNTMTEIKADLDALRDKHEKFMLLAKKILG